MAFLPKLVSRRLGPVGVALIAYDIWKHLPARHRQLVVEQGLKHGSRVGRYLVNEGSKQIRKRLG